jgi:hypothetical protein
MRRVRGADIDAKLLCRSLYYEIYVELYTKTLYYKMYNINT